MNMQLEPQKLSKTLTYLGTLPFWYGILSALNLAPLNLTLFSEQLPLDLSLVLMVYTLVILSFIAGIHWGLALSLHNDYSRIDNAQAKATNQTIIQPSPSNVLLSNRLLISSNVIALWAWCVFVFFEDYQAWLGLAIGFSVMLLIDKVWIKLDKSIPWFWTLRWHASLIAIVCALMHALL